MKTIDDQKEFLKKYGDNYYSVTKCGYREGKLWEVSFIFGKDCSNLTKKIVDIQVEKADEHKMDNELWILWEGHAMTDKKQEVKDAIYKHFNL